MENKEFKAFDLHVHTPASSDYKLQGDDEEYFNILQRYVDEKVKIIAITDHNTIDGYKKIMQLKDKLFNFISNLQQLEKEQGMPIIDVENYQKKYELFNQICILPGVELDINPGIHILVIFNDKDDISRVDSLLNEIGYDSESCGHDKLGNINVDVLELFDILLDYDCIVIAAHADSSKGIYNDIEGQYRSQIFRNERLNGIQYISQKSADQIVRLLMNKEYRRKSPLAFIKASDFHGNYNDKPDIIYGDFTECNYENLKKAFQTPEQSISLTENPEIKSLIEKVLQLDNSISVDIKEGHVIDSLTKELCAVLNSGFGNLVIGVSNDSFKNFNGVTLEFESLEKILSNSVDELESEKSAIEIIVNEYSWGKKFIYVVHVRNSSGRITFLNDGTSYYVENGVLKVLDTKMIISKTEKNLVMKIKNYMDKNNKRISKLAKELTLLADLNSCFNFILDIDETPLRLSDIIEVEIINSNKKIEFKDTSIAGFNKYNVILSKDFPPRLERSYLRYSPYGILVNEAEFDELPSEQKFSGECILIMPKGASYYINSDDEYFIYSEDSFKPCLRITINEIFKDKISYKVLLAWLKSSLLIFYTYVNFEDISIYEPHIFKNTPIIMNELIKNNDKITELVESVLSKEIDFISKYENTRSCLEEFELNEQFEELEELEDQIDNEIDEFNDEIKSIMNQLDHIYYEIFNVDLENRIIINNILIMNNLSVFEDCISE